MDQGVRQLEEQRAIASSGGISEDPTTLRIPVVAEELVVETHPISLGAVHLHKGVHTEQQTIQVPVYHEEALVERLEPGAYDAARIEDPDALFVPIYEEELVIEKRQVLKEYIVVRKRRVEERRPVSETVRREYVEVTEQAAGASERG